MGGALLLAIDPDQGVDSHVVDRVLFDLGHNLSSLAVLRDLKVLIHEISDLTPGILLLGALLEEITHLIVRTRGLVVGQFGVLAHHPSILNPSYIIKFIFLAKREEDF